MRERYEGQHAQESGDAARDDDEPPAAPVRDVAGREDEQRADEVPDAEDQSDLPGVGAERFEVQRLQRADEPEAEAPEELDDDEESDVAGKAQALPLTTPCRRRSSKYAVACATSAGSARMSIVTRAIAFAAKSAAACASGVAAASRNAAE